MRGQWSDPWSEKIPHAVEQQSSYATTTEPLSRACKPQLLSTCTTATEPWATTTEAHTLLGPQAITTDHAHRSN